MKHSFVTYIMKDEMNQQVRDYIGSQHQAGMQPDMIKQHLVDSGWQPEVADMAIKDFFEPQSSQHVSTGNKKIKPPVAVQVFYALGFLGLLLGLGTSVVTLIFTNSAFSNSPLDGLKSTVNAAAIFMAIIYIAMFVIINFLRAGKKWALVVQTILYGLLMIGAISDATGGGENAAGGVILALLFLPFFILFWTKNKSYFDN